MNVDSNGRLFVSKGKPDRRLQFNDRSSRDRFSPLSLLLVMQSLETMVSSSTWPITTPTTTRSLPSRWTALPPIYTFGDAVKEDDDTFLERPAAAIVFSPRQDLRLQWHLQRSLSHPTRYLRRRSNLPQDRKPRTRRQRHFRASLFALLLSTILSPSPSLSSSTRFSSLM